MAGKPGRSGRRRQTTNGAGATASPGAGAGEGTGAETRTISRPGAGATVGTGPNPQTPPIVSEVPADSAPFVVTQEDAQTDEKQKRRERYERLKREKAVSEAQASAQNRDAIAASIYSVMLNGLAMTFAGPAAVMMDGERQMIEPPLARILARMDEETRAQVDRYSDPLLLTFGLVAWGSRVWRIRKDSQPQPEPEPQSEPQRQTQPEPLIRAVAPVSEGDAGLGATSPPSDLLAMVNSNGGLTL